MLLLWKTTLECVLNKNLFSCIHTHKKNHFSTTTRFRSHLVYPENAIYPVFFICRDHTKCMTKSIHRKEKPFYFIYYLPILQRAQGNENKKIKNSNNSGIKNRKLK